MAKIKITQAQYNTILLCEQKSRLKTNTAILIEDLDPSSELLEEGWREVVLGVAMMLGIGLTGQNKAIAQNAVKNDKIMSQIKNTLEDTSKTQELAKLLKEKGMKDPDSVLAQNAEKVADAFNDVAKNNKIGYTVDTRAVSNLQSLKKELGQGYAVRGIEKTTDTVKGQETKKEITVEDTADISLGSDNLFVTGGYTLSKDGVDTITTAINKIKEQGGKIQSVEVESSTDAEEIVKFKNQDDPTGNIRLANLRYQSVANLLGALDSGASIKHREIPNNGSNVVSTQQFLHAAKDAKATASLREKTKQFRYVKIKIVAIFDNKTTVPNLPPAKLIQHYRFELVKVIESTGKSHNITSNVSFNRKQFKCIKMLGNPNGSKCRTF